MTMFSDRQSFLIDVEKNTLAQKFTFKEKFWNKLKNFGTWYFRKKYIFPILNEAQKSADFFLQYTVFSRKEKDAYMKVHAIAQQI